MRINRDKRKVMNHDNNSMFNVKIYKYILCILNTDYINIYVYLCICYKTLIKKYVKNKVTTSFS